MTNILTDPFPLLAVVAAVAYVAIIYWPIRRAAARSREWQANQLVETRRQADALERIAAALEKPKV